MVLPTPPGGDTASYRRLLTAHDQYMRAVYSLMADVKPAGRIGRWVPYALFIHVFQMARAVHALLDLGYAEEALPIGRSMISATMSLLFIVTSDDPEGWSLRYWLQLGQQERRMLERELRLGRFDEDAIKDFIQQSNDTESGAIREAAAGGIILPDKLPTPGRGKPRDDTWTGLSDKALAERVGLLDWYEGEYDYLSTVTHAQAVALMPIVHGLMEGHLPTIGPHFRSPLPAVGVSYTSVKYAMLALIKHFDLVARDPEFQAANALMSAAIETYRVANGINAFVATTFGGEPNPSAGE